MRYAAVIATLAGALAAPAGAGAAVSGGPAGPLDARVRLVSCLSALEPMGRSLTVDSVMRSLRSGDHMQMRFELWQRAAGALRFRRIPGPGLGTWNSATPGVQRFRFRKPIQNLPAPASYYVRVHYRWRDDDARTFASTVRSTRLCHQPDVRPDLRVLAVGSPRRVGANRFAYPVVVHNRGRAPSGAFDAVLQVGEDTAAPATFDSLAPGARRTVELTGPRCLAGTAASVQLDPDNRVDESDERNNVRSFACA